MLEPIEDADLALAADEQRRLLEEWARSGPQGPIDAADDAELPE